MERIISTYFNLNYSDGTPFCVAILVAACKFSDSPNGRWFYTEEYEINTLTFHPVGSTTVELPTLNVLRYESLEKKSILESGVIDEALCEAAADWARTEYNRDLEQEYIEMCKRDKRYAHRTREND